MALKKIVYAVLMMGSVFSLNVHAANDSGIKVKWSYKGDIGPANWGKLDPSFRLCSTGKTQSPINIPKKANVTTNMLTMDYEPAEMVISDNGNTFLMLDHTETITNTGHSVQLNFPKSAQETISFNHHQYKLVQFHIHTPSETKLHDKSFPLEIHFVHQGDDGSAAVVAVFAKIGKENPTLKNIINHIPTEEGKDFSIKGDRINPISLIPNEKSYYHFAGSLTTPPCTQGLEWIVLDHAITVSSAQVDALNKASHGENARPIQALYHRQIELAATAKR